MRGYTKCILGFVQLLRLRFKPKLLLFPLSESSVVAPIVSTSKAFERNQAVTL